MTAPLRSAPAVEIRDEPRIAGPALVPAVSPAVEIRDVVCPACLGEGVIERIVNLRWQQDTKDIACQCNDGRVTVHLAEIDGDLRAWCPALGLLAIVDEGELESGNWTNHRAADRLNIHDRRLLAELEADL